MKVGGLKAYILRRIFQMAVTLLALTIILFLMFRLLPGDPLTMYLDATIPLEAQKAIKRQFGLDKPLHEQYFLYLANVAKGDFGRSFYHHAPVSELIGERLLNTVILMGTSIALAFVFGVIFGTLLAWKRGSRIEVGGLAAVLIARSAPLFWTGLVALFVFSYTLKWFPIGGMYTPGREFASVFAKFINLDFLHHLIMPSMVAAAYYLAGPTLIMRTSMLEVMREDFVEMANAKGLKESTVMFRHAMRNALLPVVTQLTLMIGFAVGGQVLIETIFRWPGMGRALVLAVQRNDYPMAQAGFFLLGVLVICLNFVTDMLYGYLDPRVTYK